MAEQQQDTEILSRPLRCEQKRIYLNLRENARGRYLRIAEVTGTNRSTIIIPFSGLEEFRGLLDEIIALGPSPHFPEGSQPAAAGGRGRRGRGPAAGAEPSGEPVISTRVYVGNISWNTRWQDLKDHFSSVGEVTRADVFTERSGRSRGCGLVEFRTVEEAATAIATLNNTELDGRVLYVREDREAAAPAAAAQ